MSDALTEIEDRQTRARPALIIACAATFMAFLDLSVVNIAFPSILKEYSNVSLATLTWIVSGYAATFAAFLAFAGKLADSLGRARVFLIALAAFIVASVLCGLAPTAAMLIAARFIQGVTAAALVPPALGLVLGAVPAAKRTTAVGAWAASAGFSFVVGPAIGGLLVELFDWRAVFYVNVPIGLILIIGGFLTLPREERAAGTKMPDVIGSVMFAFGIAGAIAGLTQGDKLGWSSPVVIFLLIVGPLLTAGSIQRSRSHPAPAIDVSLWSNRQFALVNGVSALFGVALFAWLLTVPLFLVAVWHWGVFKSAGAFSTGALFAMVGSLATGRAHKVGQLRWLAVLGAVLFAAACAIMGTDIFDSTVRFWSAWIPVSVIAGIGIGFTPTALSSIVTMTVTPDKYAAGIGMNLTARQVGGSFGVAGIAIILSMSNNTLEGIHRAWIASAVISALASVLALRLNRNVSTEAH